MATITINIPEYQNFSQKLDVSDKYAYRISKIIQKELRDLSEKLVENEEKPTQYAG